jgi:hypothetical protein
MVPAGTLRFGALVIQPGLRTVQRDGVTLDLTA